MNDPIPTAPLAAFDGAVPPTPEWFNDAVAHRPERTMVLVDGAEIELLTWGERGLPGLLFLHGNGAHAGWWRFIAPFFAGQYRVAAPSWAGMGGSAHRAAYTIEGFVAELFASAEAAGLYDTNAPLVVGHSFGGFPLMAAAARHGDRLRGAVIVDTPFLGADEARRPPPNATNRPHKVYPTLAAALARFRFAPEQGCPNPYIADLIAREALIESATGWCWRFDPYLWHRFEADNSTRLLGELQCPVAMIWGERSLLLTPERVAAMRAELPPGTPAIGIPEAEHHVMIDQPLAFVTALRGLFAGWPA